MNVKKISWVGLFISLTVIGAMLKVPAPISSVALDSFPALVAAVLLGPAAGALTAAFGHFISALIGGFPMGPFHFIIALEMAAAVWVFGQVYRSGFKWGGLVSFISLNGLVAPAPFIYFFGLPFYVTSVPSITIAAIFNSAAAFLLIPRLLPAFEKRFGRLHA